MRRLLAAALATAASAALLQPVSTQTQSLPVGGTGEIRGRVLAADTGAPLRRVQVSLITLASRPTVELPPVPVEAEPPDPSLAAGGGSRIAYTDEAGGYIFERVPPGTYRVTANPTIARPQYLAATHGASDATQAGRAVEVEEGDRHAGIDITVPRAAVVTGRVTDAAGDPVSRAIVFGLLFRGAQIVRTGGATTDDVGQFRLFGLAPGEYVIAAEPRMVTAQAGRGPATGHLPTFSPGTTSPAQAVRVAARAGQEVKADIRMMDGRLFRLTGSVKSASGAMVPRAVVQVARRDPFGQITTVYAASDPQGRFIASHLPPGEYRITARPPDAAPGSPRRDVETAFETVVVSRTDVTDVAVVLRPAVNVTGTVGYDPPAANPARLRVMTVAPDRWRATSEESSVEAVGNSFTLRNVSGEKLIRVSAVSGGWTLKSVLLDGRDVTDVPTRFGPQHDGRLHVTLTSRAASLVGTVMTGGRQPATGGLVVVFGQDPAAWFARSLMFRSAPVESDGTFRLYHVPEGRYFVVALPPARSPGMADPAREVLDALSKEATRLTLGAGEHRKIELRLLASEMR